jgi:hypothetical protein
LFREGNQVGWQFLIFMQQKVDFTGACVRVEGETQMVAVCLLRFALFTMTTRETSSMAFQGGF